MDLDPSANFAAASAVGPPTPAAPPAPALASSAPAPRTGTIAELAEVAVLGERLRRGIQQGMQISADRLELVICTLLAGGHLLLEDQPGVGKTQLARSIAGSIDGYFSRVQATVDLLPTDLLGASVFLPSSGTFEFRPGPVFANVLLVDELNRATPKTQSGLLQAMQELEVTIDGNTYALPRPFIVVATQNPAAGYDGTYALPPAQLDRFLARISLGYPTANQETALLRSRPEATHTPVATLEELLRARAAVDQVTATEALLEYIVALVAATRHHPLSETGASPRAGLQLLSAARARAALHGRDYALPDDVQALAEPVLVHRIQPAAGAPEDAATQVVAAALASVPAR